MQDPTAVSWEDIRQVCHLNIARWDMHREKVCAETSRWLMLRREVMQHIIAYPVRSAHGAALRSAEVLTD